MLLIAASIAVIIFSLVYYHVRYKFSYWKRRGVYSIPPSFPFGNFTKILFQRVSIGEFVRDLYRETKINHRFVGVYNGLSPTIIVNDPEIIQDILIGNFNSFKDRGMRVDEANDPIANHLFHMYGDEKWRNLRQKLTPTFTSGRIKEMFPTIIDCGRSMTEYLEKTVTTTGSIDARELMARFSTNLIVSTAFGIDIDCIKNPDNEFRVYGSKYFTPNWKRGLKVFMYFIAPSIQKLVKMKYCPQDVEDFIIRIVKEVLDYREKNNVTRRDFFQLLIQLRNTGTVALDGKWDTTIIKGETNKQLTLNEVASQAFLFLAASFETSSTTMSYCLFELAKNQEVQRIVHQEIDEVLSKHDNKVTFAAINDMRYLDACIDETLRIHPAGPVLNRECTKDYQIPNTNITIEVGTPVLISPFGLQLDSQYFPEPELFDPTRFLKENYSDKNFIKTPYLPFGLGPRNCIGSRMGKLQSKVGIFILLNDYKVRLDSSKTKDTLEFNPKSFVLMPKGGIHLKISRRKG